MKQLFSLALSVAALVAFSACGKQEDSDPQHAGDPAEGDKPIQHLQLPDITSQDDAVKVLGTTTEQLKAKETLDPSALGEIHIITYSLEKAIAYFAENLEGEPKAQAEKMAEVVETVHLNSENLRVEETRAALTEYFALEEAFSQGL